MPNQPKTPARTFRMSDETMASIARLGENMKALSNSDALRKLVQAADSINGRPVPYGIPGPAVVVAGAALDWPDTIKGVSQLAYALREAEPYLVEDVRNRTIEEIIGRLQGHVPTGDVSQQVVDMLKSLLP